MKQSTWFVPTQMGGLLFLVGILAAFGDVTTEPVWLFEIAIQSPERKQVIRVKETFWKIKGPIYHYASPDLILMSSKAKTFQVQNSLRLVNKNVLSAQTPLPFFQ